MPKPQGTQLQIFRDLKQKSCQKTQQPPPPTCFEDGIFKCSTVFFGFETKALFPMWGAVPRYCLTYPYLNLSHFQPQQQQARFNFDAADAGRICFMYLKSQWVQLLRIPHVVVLYGRFQKLGAPQNGWFIVEK